MQHSPVSRRNLPKASRVSGVQREEAPSLEDPRHVGRQEGPTPESQRYLDKAQLSFLPHVLDSLEAAFLCLVSQGSNVKEFLYCSETQDSFSLPQKWLQEFLLFGAEGWPDMGASSGRSLSQ